MGYLTQKNNITKARRKIMQTNEIKRIHDGITRDICNNRDYSVLEFIEKEVVGDKYKLFF